MLTGILLGFLGFSVSAQDCEAFYPMDEGAFLETKSYSDKDKHMGTSRMTVLEKQTDGNRTSVLFNVKSFDEKDKELLDGQMEVYCEDGVFYVDMKKFLDQATLQSFEGMEMVMESENMEFPSNLRPGQSLSDASINVAVRNSGITMFNMNVWVTNRKVEAMEDITTPAGTFTCYKISSDIETKMMVKISARSVEWYAKDVGVVRSESYNSKGKLTGYTMLTGFSN